MTTSGQETESKESANGRFLFVPPGTETVEVKGMGREPRSRGNGLFSGKEEPVRESARRRIAIQGGQEPFPRKSLPFLVSR